MLHDANLTQWGDMVLQFSSAKKFEHAWARNDGVMPEVNSRMGYGAVRFHRSLPSQGEEEIRCQRLCRTGVKQAANAKSLSKFRFVQFF